MAVNRAVSSHDGQMGLTRAGVPDPAIMRQGRMTLRAKVDEADHSARMRETPSLICRCNIGEMPRKVPVKCAIAGCHRRLKMTLAEREELRRVGRENNATAGVVCPADVQAAFNFEFDDIEGRRCPAWDELRWSEASQGQLPRWRVMLTPLPTAASRAEPESTQV